MQQFRNNEFSTNNIAAVIGAPIKQSQSPVLHNVAYQFLKLDNWSYSKIEVTPEILESFVAQVKADAKWRGFSITMPLKHAIFKYLDEVDPLAKKTQAVNTVVVQRADSEDDVSRVKLSGYNTDVYGIIQAFYMDERVGKSGIMNANKVGNSQGKKNSTFSQASDDIIAAEVEAEAKRVAPALQKCKTSEVCLSEASLPRVTYSHSHASAPVDGWGLRARKQDTQDSYTPPPRTALILGNGATSRSAYAALEEMGVQDIRIAARRSELDVDITDVDVLARAANEVDLVVCTLPWSGAESVLPTLAKRVDFDLKPMLECAFPRTLETSIRGELMLVHQAIKQVELMTDVSLDELARIDLADLMLSRLKCT